MKLAMQQQHSLAGEDVSGFDRYILRVVLRHALGRTVVVDEVSTEEVIDPAGPRLILHWQRVFDPTGAGPIDLGTFGDLSVEAYAHLKRALSQLVADRRELIDVAELVADAQRATAPVEDVA